VFMALRRVAVRRAPLRAGQPRQDRRHCCLVFASRRATCQHGDRGSSPERVVADEERANKCEHQTAVDEYVDLPLGFPDAAVIACAERSGGRVLTLDLRN